MYVLAVFKSLAAYFTNAYFLMLCTDSPSSPATGTAHIAVKRSPLQDPHVQLPGVISLVMACHSVSSGQHHSTLADS